MKLLATALVFQLAISQAAFATSQIPENLILDGEELSLETNPLAALIHSKRILLPDRESMSTANWRGYVGTWTVSDGKFLLEKLEMLQIPEGAAEGTRAVPVDVLPQLFDGQTRVEADWFSGTLVVPRGEVLDYVHMGYGSTHERYTILHIGKGRVRSRDDLNAAQFEKLRKERFEAYKKTAEYASRFKEARDELDPDQAENFLYHFAVEAYMSQGR